MRTDRIEKIINSTRQRNMDRMVISDPSTISYLTDKFVASGVRLFTLCPDIQGACTFFINSLQADYAPLVEGTEVIWYTNSGDSIQILTKKVRVNGAVGIDKSWPSNFPLRLMAAADAKYMLNSRTIDYIRMVRGDREIQLMCKTQTVNEKVVSEMFQYASSEFTEQKHHRMLHEMYYAHGTDGYNTIGMVAYGKSYGYTHHKPGRTTPVAGDCIIIDAGMCPNGYRSGMARTMSYKSVSDEMRNICEVVKEAQLIAMDATKPGMWFCDIDRIGRGITTEYGCGEYFTHRIGRNIGIDSHEFPDVGGASTMKVLPNMTFSVGSGICIPSLSRVRIKDLMTVTEDDYECLNKMSKDLWII